MCHGRLTRVERLWSRVDECANQLVGKLDLRVKTGCAFARDRAQRYARDPRDVRREGFVRRVRRKRRLLDERGFDGRESLQHPGRDDMFVQAGLKLVHGRTLTGRGDAAGE